LHFCVKKCCKVTKNLVICKKKVNFAPDFASFLYIIAKKDMKKLLTILSLLLLTVGLWAEVSPETLAKRAKRKNLVVKEWNTDATSRTKWLDHLTVYDSEGRKIEEIEYNIYGQVQRVVTKYNDESMVSEEVVYNSKNQPVRIRKYEYNENGTKAKQYNYLPNGKLYSTKVYEYHFAD